MNKAAAKTGKQTAKINKSENYVTRCNSSKHNQARGGGRQTKSNTKSICKNYKTARAGEKGRNSTKGRSPGAFAWIMGLKLSKRWLLVSIRWSVSFSHQRGATRWIIICFKDNSVSSASTQQAWQHWESITHYGPAHPWVLALISVTSRSTKTFPVHPEPSGLLPIPATPASPPSQGFRALPPQPRARSPSDRCTPG